MAAELIWTRLYTYFVGPFVYSFAEILAAYLLATFCGSQLYRFWSRHGARQESPLLWVSLAMFGLLPLLTADPRLELQSDLRIFLGVFPFSAVIGFLTPMLVDRWSEGDPDRAGRAYAVNVIGCIVGPLLSGFVLLPWFGERTSMLLLVLPWIGMALFGQRKNVRGLQLVATATLVIAAVTLFFFTKDYEADFPGSVTLRDRTATVLATGEDMDKMLLVNGVGMTSLTPITKMMAHYTLAHLAQPPRNALIICFGMGTTFRSAMSWGIPVTVVELVPSVPKVFTYYHPDGGALLQSPKAHIVIDDGRRFLDRSSEKFDAVIIDPPPPLEAAASSLLYSRDFYALARQHMTTRRNSAAVALRGRRCGPSCGHARADGSIPVRARLSIAGGRIELSLSCEPQPHPAIYRGGAGSTHAAECAHRHDGMGTGQDSGRTVRVAGFARGVAPGPDRTCCRHAGVTGRPPDQ